MIKKLKGVISKLISTGFVYVFGSTVINKIIAFLSNIVIVHILSKADYGIFTYAWNIYAVVSLVNGLGVDSGLIQLCSEKGGDREYTEKISSYASRIGLISDMILSLVILGIGLFVPLKISGSEKLVRMLCFLPCFQLLYSLSIAVLRSQKRNREYGLLNSINTLFIAVGSIFGSILFKESGLIIGYYFAYSVSFVVAFKVMKVRLLIRKKALISLEERKNFMSISLISVCNNSLSQLLYLLDIFVLGIIVAEETVLASYKVATQIPSALAFIPSSLVIYIYPYFAEHQKDREWCLATFRKILLCMLFVNICISGILIGFAPLIISTLFGSKYEDAVICFRILVLNYFIAGTFRTISGNLLVTQRKLKFNLLVGIVSGIANVLADILLIKNWGSVGASVATVSVSVIASLMCTPYLLYTFRNIPTDN